MSRPGSNCRSARSRPATVSIARAALSIAFALVLNASVLAAPLVGRIAPLHSAVVAIDHVAPYTCGVTSSKFARICRPGIRSKCDGAVARGVKGFSSQLCAARHTACVSCLSMLRSCIKRIGHGPRNHFSCDECTGKFSRCIGKRYPVIQN
jgi:hypothetical protein